MDLSSDESHLATAMEYLNINNYWPESESICENEPTDEKYNIHHLYELLVNDMMNCFRVVNIERNVDELENSFIGTTLSLGAEESGTFEDGFTNSGNVFQAFSYCIAYVHRYAGCYAAMVRDALKTAFHVHPTDTIKRFLALKDSLVVVSLGSGPGNDLVGFCSALYGKHYGINKMELIAVDKHLEWDRFFFKTWSLLDEECFSVAKVVLEDIEVHKHFVVEDLTEKRTWMRPSEDKLETADIFLLVKVLSLMSKSHATKLLQNVAETMKPGALLVYIDRPFPQNAFDAVENLLECVYQQSNQRFDFDFSSRNSNRPILNTCYSCVAIYMKKLDETDD